jgi:catechol 2,3-dioxygenase-like lactoylglutathione lyase family enzyme
MFVRIDHVMICVPDLAAGIEQFRNLGFNMHPGGVHPGVGTHNAIAFNRDDYVELLALHDRAEYDRIPSQSRRDDGGLPAFLAAGGGIRYVIIQSDNLEADIAGMRARGVDVSDVRAGARRTPQGVELRWKAAVLGPANRLPLFFIEHVTPLEQRRAGIPGGSDHPNRVQGIERAYIVTPDVQATAAIYAKVLGMPMPPLQKGTVIMSDMAVFQIGPNGLGIAQPYADGPAAATLARRGPIAFQALYRTESMGAAARWMQDHGLPPLPRGVRNTGEQAMLAPPELAGGAYIGFVGPE